METAMLITLTIIAITSLLMNGAQWVERRVERKDTERIIREGARLEEELKSLTATYNNEVLHRQWAVGRIQDQQACINKLKANKPVYSKQKKNQ